jgi:hypothetical protein
LINRLLDRDVLPTGVVPVTAIATTVRAAGVSQPDGAEVIFRDGRLARVDLSELPRYVTEYGNPGNERGVREVEVALDAALLARFGLEVVDTPGTGSVFEHNTVAAEQALATLDAAIFVASADPPISAAERDLLARAAQAAVHLFVVLNKADQLEAAELAEAEAFTARVVEQVVGAPVEVYPCAARKGRSDPGFARFQDVLRDYLDQRSGHDAATALQRHAAHLIDDLLDQARLTDRSLALSASSSAERVELFRSRLDSLAERQRDIADRCRTVERRTRRELDQSARACITEVSRRAHVEVEGAFAGTRVQIPAQPIDSDGRELAVRFIRDEVEAWRSTCAQRLETALRRLVDSVAVELDALLAEVRAALHELLDIEVGLQRDEELLQPSRAFWYAFEPGIGWELPFAGVVRHALPGRANRARTRLLGEVDELTDRQVGRARADLQQRLSESVRMLIGSLRAEYESTVGRVAAALDQARAISQSAVEERDRQLDELANRIDRLRGLRELLSDGQDLPAARR